MKDLAEKAADQLTHACGEYAPHTESKPPDHELSVRTLNQNLSRMPTVYFPKQHLAPLFLHGMIAVESPSQFFHGVCFIPVALSLLPEDSPTASHADQEGRREKVRQVPSADGDDSISFEQALGRARRRALYVAVDGSDITM